MLPGPPTLRWTSLPPRLQESTTNTVYYPDLHRNGLTPFVATRTQCEHSSRCNDNQSSSASPVQRQDEPCDVCLYTGVATCFGLSLYFLKTAFLDLPESTSQSLPTKGKVQNQKRFLLLLSGASAVSGVYRLYLG
jgi:hypothetical protein